MGSLRARLLAATGLALAAFVALAGLSLENAFRNSLQLAQQQKMEGLVYALLAAAALDERGELSIAQDNIPDPRLRQPLSGLQAALFDAGGHAIWSSAAFLDMPAPGQPEVGEWRFARLSYPNVFAMSFGLRWIDLADDTRRYTVMVLEDAAALDEQLGTFRRTLWGWLGGTALALTALLLVLMRWSLAPLNRLGRELQQVETGTQPQILGQYPDELRQLTHDLNAMIISERNQQMRYRNALGDLAHSIKTPLAVLRGLPATAPPPEEMYGQLDDQVLRIQRIVDTQLRLAASAGTRVLSEPVLLRPIADKIIAALAKVYVDKGIRFENTIRHDLRLRADQGDLFELLGNLLDNAAKYGRTAVRVGAMAGRTQCLLIVEDDGPGFPANPDHLLERGVRADNQMPGQGIGLSAVAEMVKVYEGKLILDRSPLGGGKVVVALPTR